MVSWMVAFGMTLQSIVSLSTWEWWLYSIAVAMAIAQLCAFYGTAWYGGAEGAESVCDAERRGYRELADGVIAIKMQTSHYPPATLLLHHGVICTNGTSLSLSFSLQAVETNLASKDSHWVFVNEVREAWCQQTSVSLHTHLMLCYIAHTHTHTRTHTHADTCTRTHTHTHTA